MKFRTPHARNNTYIYMSTIPNGAYPLCIAQTAKELSLQSNVLYVSPQMHEPPGSVKHIAADITHLLWNVITDQPFIQNEYVYTRLAYGKQERTNQLQYCLCLIYLFIQKYIYHRTVHLMVMDPSYDAIHTMPFVDFTHYDCTDIYFPEIFKKYKKTIQSFDAIFTHTTLQRDAIQAYNPRVYILSPGHHARTTVDRTRNKLSRSVVFAGGISKRINYDFLYNIVTRLKHIDFYFIGDIYLHAYYVHPQKDARAYKKWVRLKKQPNVHYIEAMAQKDLYTVLSFFKVGIIPYTSTDSPYEYSNRNTLPIKLSEYLASGLSVVSTALPAIAQLQRGMPIYTTDSVDKFTKAITYFLQRNTSTQSKQITQFIRSTNIQNKIKQIIAITQFL